MFVNLSRALCDSGIASLRFDLSGRGDSGGVYGDTERKRYSTEQIVQMLREAEVLQSQGLKTSEITKKLVADLSIDNQILKEAASGS